MLPLLLSSSSSRSLVHASTAGVAAALVPPRLRRTSSLVKRPLLVARAVPVQLSSNGSRTFFLAPSDNSSTTKSASAITGSIMRTNGWTDSKLLVLSLLRTVSAWAATDSRLSASRSASLEQQQHPHHHHQQHAHHLFRQPQQQQLQQQQQPPPASPSSLPALTLRLARRQDVPSIQRCNLATLPENYNQQFYANHLREWPDLAFVAVDVSASATSSPAASSPPAYSSFPPGGVHQPEEKVVAYVLGKVEERLVRVPVEETLQGWHDRANFLQDWRHREQQHVPRLLGTASQQQQQHLSAATTTTTTERLGHVTSLAVLEPYRRRGLAAELMRQLHYHLAAAYQVESVGLHVRKSNVAAERLYAGFGYRADDCIPGYYQDGEDAYFMKKKLPQSHGSSSSSSLFGSVLRQRRVWETGPEDLRLPRRVGENAAPHASNPEDATPELLTGTM